MTLIKGQLYLIEWKDMASLCSFVDVRVIEQFEEKLHNVPSLGLIEIHH